MKKTILLLFAIIAFTVNDTFAQQPDENKQSGLVFTERMGRETHGSSKYIEEENQVHMEEVLHEEETGIRMIILEILATSLLI